MAMYIHIDGVDVGLYYDKINYSVTFTHFEQHISGHLVVYVIKCMMSWSFTMVMVLPIECKFSL